LPGEFGLVYDSAGFAAGIHTSAATGPKVTRLFIKDRLERPS